MRNIVLNLATIGLLFSMVSCNSVNGKKEKAGTVIVQTDQVEVYYFHFTRRCATCMAVESVTKTALEELYNAEMKNESIIFQSINLDEADSEEIAQKLEISGQTLLIVSDGKKENITTDAFMNAKNNPEKLKEIIKSIIDPLVRK